APAPSTHTDLPQAPPGARQFSAVSLLGLEPSEPAITAVADTLIAGRWFHNEDEVGIILPDHVAANLGLGEKRVDMETGEERVEFSASDVGKKILVFGQELPVVGILDHVKFDALRDIDGEPLTPVNFSQQRLLDAQKTEEEQIDTLKEYVHYPVDQLVVVPYRWARDVGATIRSIAIGTGQGVDPEAEAEAYARRSNLTILASNGERVQLYASLYRSRLSTAGQILIPVLLGFIMVLGTMLGSVYERFREIFVYNSVGLSPNNVASLFLAESAVYAVIGASAGYLLGQLVSKLLLSTGMLAGLNLNYSAGSTVFVTVLTMGIVLVSTIYPARQAFRMAIPEQRRHFEGIEESAASAGDRISIFLPFVATPDHVFAMQAYMQEFLDSVQGVSVGRLAVDHLRSGIETVAHRPAPTLYFKAWLAPFDLGISHDAKLQVVFRPEQEVFQYHLTAVRSSGDHQNWRRLTPQFILAIRKQLLMWRILAPEDQLKYEQRAEALFGPTTA
ncbi:MAG TPA: ABC transporter permease, partial [Candidatus Hydrogenedentes bacterium]|nr:ABC transporter permease [Candidatus Hydrogenedentota bacterium]